MTDLTRFLNEPDRIEPCPDSGRRFHCDICDELLKPEDAVVSISKQLIEEIKNLSPTAKSIRRLCYNSYKIHHRIDCLGNTDERIGIPLPEFSGKEGLARLLSMLATEIEYFERNPSVFFNSPFQLTYIILRIHLLGYEETRERPCRSGT